MLRGCRALALLTSGLTGLVARAALESAWVASLAVVTRLVCGHSSPLARRRARLQLTSHLALRGFHYAGEKRR